MMTNSDLARIINSDEIQSVVRPATSATLVLPKKRNPIKNSSVRIALNPYHAVVKSREEEKKALNKTAKAKVVESKIKELVARREFKVRRREFYRAAVKEGEVKF